MRQCLSDWSWVFLSDISLLFLEREIKSLGMVSRKLRCLLFVLWCLCSTVWNYHELVWFSCFCIALQEGNRLNPGSTGSVWRSLAISLSHPRQQHCACAHVAFDIFLNACQTWARQVILQMAQTAESKSSNVILEDLFILWPAWQRFFVCFSDNPLIRLWVVSIVVLLAIVFASTIMV